MTTEEALMKQYGILISMKDCAELLGRSTEGLRVTLCRNTSMAEKFKKARVKLGRRVMFKSSAIAQIIDEA
ncbi:MAG TPA: DNA-binding protein [Methylotenera sp.]|nr:DNA-binding protein [Methylotenera sp.]HPN02186.1 DNA-binding protein [Methylotenera sp.]